MAFVSEHSETLVELDIEYKKLAEKNGCSFYKRITELVIEENFIILFIYGDKWSYLNKVKNILKKNDVVMADDEQVKNQTGFSIDGVAPVAHLNKNKVWIDASLSRYEHVYVAAGHPHTIFKISYKQLIKLTKGT